MFHLVLVSLLPFVSGAEARREQGAPPPPPPPPIVRDHAPADAKTGKAGIRGRVTSADTGRPLRRAQIRITGGELTQPRTASTNISGRFEVKDLPAGRYNVHVTRSGYLPLTFGQRRPGEPGKPIELSESQVAENIDFVLPRMAVITGRVIDEVGEPVAGAQIYSLQPRYYQGQRRLVPVGGLGVRTDDAGQYRLLNLAPGEYVVMATLRETWPLEDDPTQVIGYAPSYYPGTPNTAEAQRVKVGLGQEVTAIDVQLVPGRTATVSGFALSSSGAPLGGQTVTLSQEISGPGMMSMMSAGSTRTAGDGSWTFRHVQNGEYRVTLRSTAGEQPEQGDMVVTVTGSDLEGLTLVAGPGGTLRGQVVLEDGFPLAAPLDRLVVRGEAIGQPRSRFPSPSGADNGRVGKDGTFALTSAAGSLRLNLTVPAPWSIKGIELEGRDIGDKPIELAHGQTLDGIRIVLTNRPAVVRGAVLDERTRAASDGTVLVFSANESAWYENSRSVRMARPDQQGRYEIRGLPPGEYLAVALDYIQDGHWNDPEFLSELRSRAERFTIADSEARQMDLVVRK